MSRKKPIKCPKCGHKLNLGTLMGSRTSDAKKESSKANASKPPRPGSKPRGRPRKTEI